VINNITPVEKVSNRLTYIESDLILIIHTPANWFVMRNIMIIRFISSQCCRYHTSWM